MYNLFLIHHPHSWPGRRPRRPTSVNEGQRRPTKMKQRRKRAQTTLDASFGPWVSFFFECTIYFLPTTPIVGPDDAHEGPRRPTAANEGQRRPTKMKRRLKNIFN